MGVQELMMLIGSKKEEQDLFKTDVNFIYINMNENYSIPNKYRKRDEYLYLPLKQLKWSS